MGRLLGICVVGRGRSEIFVNKSFQGLVEFMRDCHGFLGSTASWSGWFWGAIWDTQLVSCFESSGGRIEDYAICQIETLELGLALLSHGEHSVF